ncbi:ABC transporter substrate-binding protein [Streptomyces sp. DSM 44915]|uniref:ABC transporter substrate-binding protein n=1 Tax=Streptomyces chisholmiae TaxID=3075540 RepID=A0ABU2JVH2_9ACTN|nr:ABC transporter substrate-binding protein [Streptomyces sp. DSM 44915]MDT0268549.1 ABC transporter substrate-binding protein [Streptomyces sp. DSM 44915]
MTRAPLTGPLAAATAATLLLAGCAGDAASAGGGSPTQLRVAYGWYPTCFDYAQSNPFALFGRQVLDTLLSENPETGELEPYLAESWETLDGGRAYEFTLREGVTFSNGEELTAAVVADNFESLWALAEQGVSITPGAYLRGYQQAEAIDEQTVRVTFDEPNAGFLQANTEGQFGIIAPASLAATPEERCAEGTIGSGPFVLDERVQDERVEYLRRDGYDWGPAAFGRAGEAALERVTIQIVPEESLRAAGVVSGEYDLAYSITDTGLAQAEGVDEVETVLAADRSVVNTLVVNTADPVLADPAVRQALQRGIDRAEFVETFYGAGVEPATDVVSRGHRAYTDHSELLTHDPECSQATLEEAGWLAGSDGVRVRDGERLEIELTFAGSDIGTATAGWEYLQSQLADLGIALELRQVSDAEQADLRTSGQWQLAVYQGASRGDADGIAAFYATDLAPWSGQAPRPEVDGPLAEQATTVDPEERQRLVDEAVTAILEQGYGIPLFDSAQVLLARDSVRDLTFPINAWEPILHRVQKD